MSASVASAETQRERRADRAELFAGGTPNREVIAPAEHRQGCGPLTAGCARGAAERVVSLRSFRPQPNAVLRIPPHHAALTAAGHIAPTGSGHFAPAGSIHPHRSALKCAGRWSTGPGRPRRTLRGPQRLLRRRAVPAGCVLRCGPLIPRVQAVRRDAVHARTRCRALTWNEQGLPRAGARPSAPAARGPPADYCADLPRKGANGSR
jgi:hypothetical protein